MSGSMNGEAISAAMRQASARKILAGAGVVQPPFRVEPFEGALILPNGGAGGGHRVTDQHIVDARGRTVHVIPFDDIGNRKQLKRRAERYCQGMNEVTGER